MSDTMAVMDDMGTEIESEVGSSAGSDTGYSVGSSASVPEVVDDSADDSAEDISSAAQLFDRDDPRSLYNIIPKWMRDAIDNVDPRVMLLPEHKLRESARADARLNRIRLAFWSEYEEAQAMVRNVDFYSITNRTGVTTTYIKQLITANQYTVAYVLNQPIEYSQFLEESLNAGLGRLREILDAPMIDADTGRMDHKMAELILKATAFIDLRVHGGIVEKRIQMNQNHNTSTHIHEHVFDSKTDRTRSARLLTGNGTANQLEQLDAKIKELEGKQEFMEARSSMPKPEAITAESIRGKRSPERGSRQADRVFNTKLDSKSGKKYRGTE